MDIRRFFFWSHWLRLKWLQTKLDDMECFLALGIAIFLLSTVDNAKSDIFPFRFKKSANVVFGFSGQSYNHFTIVNYDSKVVIWANL